MKKKLSKATEFHLRVFADRSELVFDDGQVVKFKEGRPTSGALARTRKVKLELEKGYLTDVVKRCIISPSSLSSNSLEESQKRLLDSLVESITSEVGRALVGLTVLQLVVKAITPNQCIRLHKGGSGDFSWVEGMSMRSIDKAYITPVLRSFDLLSLNRDGFMMTRSLAENYPYSLVYKAAIRGAKREWSIIVELLDSGKMPPVPALEYLISGLINNAVRFKELSASAMQSVAAVIDSREIQDSSWMLTFGMHHLSTCDHKARVFEIFMHSLCQALDVLGVFGDVELRPLSQMRSANKKHGNIGDVELISGKEIVESWDGKYGKMYLRDELDELSEKLSNHSEVRIAGFVTSEAPERSEEILRRLLDLQELHHVDVRIVDVHEWVGIMCARAAEAGVNERALTEQWFTAYVESLGQMRRHYAPIDEPCQQWLTSLLGVLDESRPI